MRRVKRNCPRYAFAALQHGLVARQQGKERKNCFFCEQKSSKKSLAAKGVLACCSTQTVVSACETDFQKMTKYLRENAAASGL